MTFGTLCSGIGAPEIAWQHLGWTPKFCAEIEPFPSAVLAARHPEVPNLGNMIGLIPDGPIDLLIAGTPCQSFSVAGKRGGLDDPRGVLVWEFLRIACALKPRWIVWENVPGVLSSGKGRDFGSIIRAMEKLGYGVVYRILDAQFFGVPQRRRRVFVVGHLGDHRRAAAVLFDAASLRGNPAPRAKAGKDVTGTLGARTTAGGGHGTDLDTQGGLVAAPITSSYAKHGWRKSGNNAGADNVVVSALKTFSGGPDVVGAQANHIIPAVSAKWAKGSVGPSGDECQNLVAEAYDQRGREGGAQFEGPHDTANIRASTGGSSRSFVAFTCKDHRGDAGEQVAMAIRTAQTGANGIGIAENVSHTLDRAQGQAIILPSAVRRLTPIECERLQGFPDNYTLIDFHNKPAADGPRYRAIGNSMAVPVIRWLGERIALVDEIITNIEPHPP